MDIQNRNDFNFAEGSWTDICNPQGDTIHFLSSELGLSPIKVNSYLQSDLLPGVEILDETIIIVLRVIQNSLDKKCDSVQDLTTQITLFISDSRLVSIHSQNLNFIETLKMQVQLRKVQSNYEAIGFIFNQAFDTFRGVLTDLESQINEFEEKIFSPKKFKNVVKEGFILKRKLAAYKKVLKLSEEILKDIAIQFPEFSIELMNTREVIERKYFYSEELLETITVLLNLNVSIASQRTNEGSFKTNEVMRLLTVISLFFLPLNFIVGFYGMNFENMPELKWTLGYPAIIGVMILVTVGIFIWLRSAGWLRPPEI